MTSDRTDWRRAANTSAPAKPLHNCSALTASSCEESKVKRCVVKHQSCGAVRAEVWSCRPNTPLRESCQALRVAPPPQLPQSPLATSKHLSHRIGLCCKTDCPLPRPSMAATLFRPRTSPLAASPAEASRASVCTHETGTVCPVCSDTYERWSSHQSGHLLCCCSSISTPPSTRINVTFALSSLQLPAWQALSFPPRSPAFPSSVLHVTNS